MDNPERLALDSSGNLYVADYYNNRILRFQTALQTTTQPSTNTTAGSTFATQPAFALKDIGSGLTYTDFTGSVSAAITNGTGTFGATLGGTTSVSASSGVATFSNLSINLAGAGYTLTASYSGGGSATTNTFVFL